MSIIAKLIGMVALGQTAVESRIIVQNFLTGLATVLALALIAGLMAGALLIGVHVIIYQLLVEFSGLTSLGAMCATLALGLFITIIVVVTAVHHVKHVFNLPKQLHMEPYKQPVTSRIAGIAEAFFDGLTGRSSRY